MNLLRPILTAIALSISFNAPVLGQSEESRIEKIFNSGDGPAAVREWIPIAENGDLKIQDLLGQIYETGGNGVEKDYSQAVRWYRLAAEQGHNGSRVGLGRMYRLGKGVIESHTLAVHWFRLAALTPICVLNSSRDPNMEQVISEMKAARAYQRSDFIVKAGWATMPGASEPNLPLSRACVREFQDRF